MARKPEDLDVVCKDLRVFPGLSRAALLAE
jgi:hypothetical protein